MRHRPARTAERVPSFTIGSLRRSAGRKSCGLHPSFAHHRPFAHGNEEGVGQPVPGSWRTRSRGEVVHAVARVDKSAARHGSTRGVTAGPTSRPLRRRLRDRVRRVPRRRSPRRRVAGPSSAMSAGAAPIRRSTPIGLAGGRPRPRIRSGSPRLREAAPPWDGGARRPAHAETRRSVTKIRPV